jgi:hypothetical protein
MLTFLAGFIAGIFALAIFAVNFNKATRPSPESKRSIAALSLDVSGNAPRANTLGELTALFREPTNGSA